MLCKAYPKHVCWAFPCGVKQIVRRCNAHVTSSDWPTELLVLLTSLTEIFGP